MARLNNGKSRAAAKSGKTIRPGMKVPNANAKDTTKGATIRARKKASSPKKTDRYGATKKKDTRTFKY